MQGKNYIPGITTSAATVYRYRGYWGTEAAEVKEDNKFMCISVTEGVLWQFSQSCHL